MAKQLLLVDGMGENGTRGGTRGWGTRERNAKGKIQLSFAGIAIFPETNKFPVFIYGCRVK